MDDDGKIVEENLSGSTKRVLRWDWNSPKPGRIPEMTRPADLGRGSGDLELQDGVAVVGRFESVLFRQGEWVLSDGLGDGAGANEADGDPTGDDGTVFDDLNFLQVPTVDSPGDARGFATVASQVFGFAAFRLFVAATGFEVAIEFNKSGAFDAFVLFQSAHWGCALTEKKSRAGRIRIIVIREKIGEI